MRNKDSAFGSIAIPRFWELATAASVAAFCLMAVSMAQLGFTFTGEERRWLTLVIHAAWAAEAGGIASFGLIYLAVRDRRPAMLRWLVALSLGASAADMLLVLALFIAGRIY
jgi:hypothetical protein